MSKAILKIALLSLICISWVKSIEDGSEEQEMIRIEDFPINDKESFYIEYDKIESGNYEVGFIKQHFPQRDTILSNGEYTFFLQEYLMNHFYKFTEIERAILKAVKEDYLTMAVSYMQEYKKREEKYGLENAYEDLIHGEFFHYLHDLIDHGAPVDEGFDSDENDNYVADL